MRRGCRNQCAISGSGVSARRQPLDARNVEARQRVPHPDAGDPAIGRDLGKRHQHEGALEQARVRQDQVRSVEPHVVIGEEVDVERARTPAPLVGAVAAERALDREAARQQLARRERGRNGETEIDEWRLVLHAPGRRAVVGRAGEQAHVPCRRRTSRPPGRASRAHRRRCRRARSAPQPWNLCAHDSPESRSPRVRGHAPRVRWMVMPTSLKIAAIGA